MNKNEKLYKTLFPSLLREGKATIQLISNQVTQGMS